MDKIKELVNDISECFDGHGIPNLDYLEDKVNELKKLVNKTNDIHDVSESSWAYYEKELDKIEQLNQTQSSLHKQMFILRQFANKLGLYDLSDYLKR